MRSFLAGTAMALAEEINVEVAIIGNGPSALALSSVLSGEVPQVAATPQRQVREYSLRAAVAKLGGAFLDETDLSKVAAGISRRCINPTAALVDALRFPDGDGRGASLLRSGPPRRLIKHLVVGAGLPGGSWHTMSPTTMSLSPGTWMDLPGDYSLIAHLGSESASKDAVALAQQFGSAEALANARVPRWLVSEYYLAYAKRLPASSLLQGTVEALEERGTEDTWKLRVAPAQEGAVDVGCEHEGCSRSTTPTIVNAKAVVLAGGIADAPLRLGIAGEDLPWVTHRPPTRNAVLLQRIGHLVVVGAGLSAADTIISILLKHKSVTRISHVFRGPPEKTKVGKMFPHPAVF
eukprot:gb/GFBE01056996.1/.p1 GENE.gb/GFBE01056996.1/~~gb/GFBE01056996.1/.p1  ORF type:complete len:350 (+),score=53.51 gb/GFBE01056996.1/:1-1050(+)